MLAESLVGVVSQQLLRRADGRGRVVAYELLVRTPSIANLIRESKSHQVPNAIQTGRKLGMRQLDMHLRALVESGVVTPEEAIRVAVDPSQFYDKVNLAPAETVEA